MDRSIRHQLMLLLEEVLSVGLSGLLADELAFLFGTSGSLGSKQIDEILHQPAITRVTSR